MTIGRIYSDLKAMFELLAWITFIFFFTLFVRDGLQHLFAIGCDVVRWRMGWLVSRFSFDMDFQCRNCKARDSDDKVVVTNWLDFDEKSGQFCFNLETIGRISFSTLL